MSFPCVHFLFGWWSAPCWVMGNKDHGVPPMSSRDRPCNNDTDLAKMFNNWRQMHWILIDKVSCNSTTSALWRSQCCACGEQLPPVAERCSASLGVTTVGPEKTCNRTKGPPPRAVAKIILLYYLSTLSFLAYSSNKLPGGSSGTWDIRGYVYIYILFVYSNCMSCTMIDCVFMGYYPSEKHWFRYRSLSNRLMRIYIHIHPYLQNTYTCIYLHTYMHRVRS
jgi:hypothetical protein